METGRTQVLKKNNLCKETVLQDSRSFALLLASGSEQLQSEDPSMNEQRGACLGSAKRVEVTTVETHSLLQKAKLHDLFLCESASAANMGSGTCLFLLEPPLTGPLDCLNLSCIHLKQVLE